MFKPKMLLKVVSVILIILGVLGLIGTGISYVMLPKMGELPGMDVSLLEETFTPFNLIASVVSSLSCIGAGIFGVSGKSVRWAAICAGIYTALLAVSMAQSVMNGTFTAIAVIDVILPVLYWWGLYQSKE